MDLIVKYVQTVDLSNKELVELCAIFKKSFSSSMTSKRLINKYTCGVHGYSWHALVYCKQTNLLVGSYTLLPRLIHVDNKKIIGIQSVDTCFPHIGIVSPFFIKKIALSLHEIVKVDLKSRYGNIFLFGFPNGKFRKLSEWIFDWKIYFIVDYTIALVPLFAILREIRTMPSSVNILNTQSIVINGIDSINRTMSLVLLKGANLGLSQYEVHLILRPIPIICIFRFKKDKFTRREGNLLRACKLACLLLLSLLPALRAKAYIYDHTCKQLSSGNFVVMRFNCYALYMNDSKPSGLDSAISPLWNDVP